MNHLTYKNKYISGALIVFILFIFYLFLAINAPSMEDPFNLGGHRIYKNYYLYRFVEGKEPNNYYLWRKYNDLPAIPFSENISSMIRKNEYQLYVCIDHEWYLIDMKYDNITKINFPPNNLYYEIQFPDHFWRNL